MTLQQIRPDQTLVRLEREAGLTIPQLNTALHVTPDDRWRVYGNVETIRESLDTNRRRLAELASLPSADAIEDLAKRAAEAMQVSTPAVLEREVVQLVGAYPKAALTDPAVYISALIFDLADMGISDAVLVETCRTIRRTLKFVPAIAEVLQVATAIMDKWQSLPQLAHKRRVVQRMHEAAVADAEKRLAEELAHREARKAFEERRQAKAKPVEAAAPKQWVCPFPSLQRQWHDRPDLLALLRSANTDVLGMCSSALATKGAEVAEALLRRKTGAADRGAA